MNRLTKIRFEALAGYSRHPCAPLSAQELAWYEEADETVLGVVSLDVVDRDFLFIALGRDAKGRFRAIDVEHGLPSVGQAKRRLAQAVARLATTPGGTFPQGDETGKRLDFFRPVVAADRQHPHFRVLSSERRYAPALGLLRELMQYYEDADGNFVEQFQSEGFDARLWELYLYALFVELGYRLDRTHPAPDFHCSGLAGEFFVEATTLNPSSSAPDLSSEDEYVSQYVPMRFAKALGSKLDRHYWKLPHVGDNPLAIAIQDFHAPRSMVWSSEALVEYLYGIRQANEAGADGAPRLTSRRVEKYTWRGREVASGFFRLPEADRISAVLANPAGTLTKFARMGFLAGFGSRRTRMLRKGVCFRDDSEDPKAFTLEVHAPGYSETWCEGLSVYHNPNARHPLPEDAFPSAAHHTVEGDRIASSLPPFFPVQNIHMFVDEE